MPYASVQNSISAKSQRLQPLHPEAMQKFLSALIQLGLEPVTLYGFYRLGFKLGFPQRAIARERLAVQDWQAAIDRLKILPPLPEKDVCAPSLARQVWRC